MRLEDLKVLHLAKSDAEKRHLEQMAGRMPRESVFRVDSCQRWLWVTSEQVASSAGVTNVRGLQIFSGKEAYLFLLRVATGLESQIKGETDIFGQIKEAWAASGHLSQSMRTDLSPWIQRLFEDTKEIRTQFIRNAGGASYGSLLRHLMKDHQAKGPVLLVGAGQLARSIAPYFLDEELWISNRTHSSAQQLKSSLEGNASQNGVHILDTETRVAEAWKSASTVILCVPLDPDRDSERIGLWKQGGASENRILIHLGTHFRDAGLWTNVPECKFLDDLYRLEKSQSELRSIQLLRAASACEERAKLRALGGSLSISHGWEDLAVFT